MYIVLVVLVVLLLVGGLPQVGMHQLGYGPSGLLGIVLVILLIYVLLGRG